MCVCVYICTLYTLDFTPHTWHLTLHTLHFHSPHSELYTWHSTLLHFTLRTPHSALYTSFHSTLYTWHPTPPTPHSALYTLHSAIYTLHFTLYTVRSTLYTLQPTLYTLHFHTLHLTLHFSPAQLYTCHPCPWMERWPSFIFMLRTHAYLTSLTSAFHCVLLPALPKVHSDAEGWPFHLPQSLVIMLALLSFLILFVQHYIKVICSHPRPLQHTSPQYVGLEWFGCSSHQHAAASDPLVHFDEKTEQLRCALCVFMPSSLPS